MVQYAVKPCGRVIKKHLHTFYWLVNLHFQVFFTNLLVLFRLSRLFRIFRQPHCILPTLYWHVCWECGYIGTHTYTCTTTTSKKVKQNKGHIVGSPRGPRKVRNFQFACTHIDPPRLLWSNKAARGCDLDEFTVCSTNRLPGCLSAGLGIAHWPHRPRAPECWFHFYHIYYLLLWCAIVVVAFRVVVMSYNCKYCLLLLLLLATLLLLLLLLVFMSI